VELSAKLLETTAVANTDTVDQQMPTAGLDANLNAITHRAERLNLVPLRLLALLLLRQHLSTIPLQDVGLLSVMLFVNRPVTTVAAKMDTVEEQMSTVGLDVNLNATTHPVERLNFVPLLLLLLLPLRQRLSTLLSLDVVLVSVMPFAQSLVTTAVVSSDTVDQQLSTVGPDANLNATINQVLVLTFLPQIPLLPVVGLYSVEQCVLHLENTVVVVMDTADQECNIVEMAVNLNVTTLQVSKLTQPLLLT